MLPPDAEPPEPVRREVRYPRYRGIEFAISLKWLLGGVLLYALLLLVAIAGNPDDAILPFLGPSLYLTPAFGLPYVLRTVHRPGRIRRMVYFFLLVPLAHMAAIYVTWDHGLSTYAFDPGTQLVRNLRSGALGGVTGAVLAFTFLHLARVTPRRRAELVVMGGAVAMLGAIGAAGVAEGALFAEAMDGRPRDAGRLIIGFECVHLPWQVAFALALAWLMRPLRRAPAPG